MGGRVVLLCGLPGSGKTTLAKQIEADLGAVRFCPDEWMTALGVDLWEEDDFRFRLEQLQWGLAQELLGHGLTVVIEWGVWAKEERDAVRERARELGAAVELRHLDLPLDELWDRIEKRNAEPMWHDRPMSRVHLDYWATIIEPPTGDELSLYDDPA